MRKLLLALAFSVLSFFPASANWTGKDATPATITFYNPAVCTSVVCVPVFQLTDGTNQVTLTTAGADGVSNTLTGQPVYGRMFNFNGTTWDRWTGAVKLNATPTLANGNGVVPTQGGAVLSATNGLYANILQGNAVNSLTNPFFMSPATGSTWSFTAASAAPVPSAAVEGTHVLKGSAGSLLSLTVTIGAVSGWVMVFDATTAPADGSVTPKYCRYIKSDGTGGATSLAWGNPMSFATGISAAFSSTGCFTKTASSTAFFAGQVQ